MLFFSNKVYQNLVCYLFRNSTVPIINSWQNRGHAFAEDRSVLGFILYIISLLSLQCNPLLYVSLQFGKVILLILAIMFVLDYKKEI